MSTHVLETQPKQNNYVKQITELVISVKYETMTSE